MSRKTSSLLFTMLLLSMSCGIDSGFVDAVCKGDVDKVNTLIAKGANVNALNKSGHRALMCAVEEGRTEIVRILIAKGADVNATNAIASNTPLMWAIIKNDTEIAKILIDAGADVNAKMNDGGTALTFAVMGGKREIRTDTVKLLLDRGADVNAKADDDKTPLMFALLHPDAVELLLGRGANVNAKTKLAARTPLMMASYIGETETVILLLANGANVNDRDYGGNRAIDLGRNDQIFQLLRSAEAR